MYKQQAYIIQSKDNNLIKKSSSGGMFAELAKYILSNSGVVFGCTMERAEEGFEVKHIYIENEKDLYKLQGSKYVQSNLGNTIKQAKEFLDNNRLVLFSGTPCQIAGLKAYLKKDYENLLTVDLSCTGTPALGIFNDYIKFLETKYKQKIIKFDFRNKEKMGWSCGNAFITFENGKTKIIYNNTSSYLNLFITKRIQKESCQKCKFSGLNRISDITLADAWGVDIEYNELCKIYFDKNKGISFVLINSPKGERFKNLIDNNIKAEKINTNKLAKYNNPLVKQLYETDNSYIEEYKKGGFSAVDNLYKKKLGMKYYIHIIKNHIPFKKYIRKFLKYEKKIDCLLFTMYACPNYGSLLTAYALQETFKQLGYNPKLIFWRSYYGKYNKDFIDKYLKLTQKAFSVSDLQNLNKITNVFVLGSDNLINLKDGNIWGVTQALLNFTDENKKRLMIGGSIGDWDGTTKSQEEHDYIKYLLQRFDFISTREESGKDVFKNVFNLPADWLNDPVFYLDKQKYIDLTTNVKEDYSNKIMQYILYPSDKTNEIINYCKKKYEKDVIVFHGNDHVKYFSNEKYKLVENWLSAIIHSNLIITDSFHCVAFALIFNRPFICIKNNHNTVRFVSLFKRLGINIPFIESVENFSDANLNYDIDLVNKSLEDIKKYAIEKVENVMQKAPKENAVNEKMNEYNKNFLKNNIPWFKKNKVFYEKILVPIVFPLKRIWIEIKNEHDRNNN